MKWFEDGPSLVDIPLPIPDPARPWEGNCAKCTSGCHGHFMAPAESLEHIQKNGYKDCMLNPPSEVIKKAFDLSRKQKTTLSATHIKDLAKQTLLPECDISFWLQHLKGIEERRAEGVKKAKATRQLRSKEKAQKEKSSVINEPRKDVYCWCAKEEYGEMVACDNPACKIVWFHFDCVGLSEAPAGNWFCNDCDQIDFP
ncbi:inhibitor of growth protein 5-like [Dendronephthya gigantea]|uniref:inhibitor of growth protein 5-like n=1 Tax=Dendronephthya gigantea TaxID=151771 RepID=UPI00106C38CC|nr:inhibitor of growth protein 5-like [Dendronephthya gigantea]